MIDHLPLHLMSTRQLKKYQKEMKEHTASAYQHYIETSRVSLEVDLEITKREQKKSTEIEGHSKTAKGNKLAS